MDIIEKAKYIDHFLNFLYDSSFSVSFANGIEMSQLPSEQNKQKFKTLEYIIEELGLVELVRGRDNSTLGGQCEYFISLKGRELMESNTSSFQMLLQRDIEKNKIGNPLFDEKEWEKYFDEKIEKRAEQAGFYLDVIVSKKIMDLEKSDIKKYFKQWFKENQEFDLQIKNGDLAIEDGDFQIVPDLDKNNMPEFVKWYKEREDDFINYLREQGVNIDAELKTQTINNMSTVINNNGDGNILNTGNDNTFNFKVSIIKGDIEKLSSELQRQGIEKEDIDELVEIVNNEQPINDSVLGQKSQNWILKIIGKSLNGTGKIAVGISANILATMIKGYYGIH